MQEIGHADDIACPVCSSTQLNLLATYSIERAAGHFCPASRDESRNARLARALARQWPDGLCQTFGCRECGFGFGWPHEGGSDEFYSVNYEQAGYPKDRWEYDFTLDLLPNRDSRVSRNALDVGAGFGAFLKKLPQGWSLYAVEQSGTAQQRLELDGITALASLDDLAKSGRKFDLITAFQVMEHISEFRNTLQAFRQSIAPDGLIVLSVPHSRYMRYIERVTGCAEMPPDHINQWTPETLTRALADAGFRVRQTKIEGASIRALGDVIYVSVRRSAETPNTLAAQIYKIPSKRVRSVLLVLPAMPIALRCIGHWWRLMRGGSFLVVAEPI